MATHKKLLLLLFSLGLMIGLFSKPDYQHENKTPWNIQTLASGGVYVFGITPGETTIQEANQILGQFTEPRLYNNAPVRLLATHEKIIIGEDVARIELEYQLDELDLAEIQQGVTEFHVCQYSKLTTEQEIHLLNKPIARIIYTPQKQYTRSAIERELGDADSVDETKPDQQIMRYAKYQLTVTINKNKPDVLIYESVMPSNTLEQVPVSGKAAH